MGTAEGVRQVWRRGVHGHSGAQGGGAIHSDAEREGGVVPPHSGGAGAVAAQRGRHHVQSHLLLGRWAPAGAGVRP